MLRRAVGGWDDQDHPSRKQLRHRFCFDEFARLVEVVINNRLGINPEGVVHGGEQFGRVNRIFCRAAAGLVGFAVDVAAFDACAGHDGGVAVRPVIAAVRAVAVAGSAHAFLRTAPEFADGHNERVLEQPAFVHVRDERG